MLFYADDGMIGSRDPKWLQESFDVLVELFKCMDLWTNVNKTKVMICMPGSLRTRESDVSYKRCQTGQGKSFHTCKQQWVDRTECGKSLVTGSLKSRMEMQHGLDLLCILRCHLPQCSLPCPSLHGPLFWDWPAQWLDAATSQKLGY